MRDLVVGAADPIEELDEASQEEGDTNDRENADRGKCIDAYVPFGLFLRYDGGHIYWQSL